MSKEETPPAGGLLSKMVRFVRNPTVQWTELDSLQDDRESQYSKQMLKEMIERKRRNDFVRRREFDQLRKLRQREVLQGHRTEDASNRPSLFQSSMASPDERAASPWTLAWSRIAGIDDAAVPLLADLFTRWADKQGQFVFSGVDRLETLLEIMTQSGDRTSGTEWWRLRMSALRLMGRPDEFELVALDYCVTFEVSPPSWAAPKCGYSDDNASANAQPQANERDMLASDFGELTLPPPIDNGPAALLSGVIEGDAVPLLQPLQELVKPGVPLVIACDKLMRIDFAAAGSVLNWAADLQSQGHVVHFQNLHRLIAVVFNVIGINEHAWVIPRKN